MSRAEVDYLKGELKTLRAKLARSRAFQKYLIGVVIVAVIAVIAK